MSEAEGITTLERSDRQMMSGGRRRRAQGEEAKESNGASWETDVRKRQREGFGGCERIEQESD